MYYPSSENKGADQLRGTAKLICVFVFAYADCWFSHGVAHTLTSHSTDVIEKLLTATFKLNANIIFGHIFKFLYGWGLGYTSDPINTG